MTSNTSHSRLNFSKTMAVWKQTMAEGESLWQGLSFNSKVCQFRSFHKWNFEIESSIKNVPNVAHCSKLEHLTVPAKHLASLIAPLFLGASRSVASFHYPDAELVPQTCQGDENHSIIRMPDIFETLIGQNGISKLKMVNSNWETSFSGQKANNMCNTAGGCDLGVRVLKLRFNGSSRAQKILYVSLDVRYIWCILHLNR